MKDGYDSEKHHSIDQGSSPTQLTAQHLEPRQFLAKLKDIHCALVAGGYRFRTRAEIDAQIREEREIWEA